MSTGRDAGRLFERLLGASQRIQSLGESSHSISLPYRVGMSPPEKKRGRTDEVSHQL